MTFQTVSTVTTTTKVAKIIRVRLGGLLPFPSRFIRAYSERVSIRSARLKSRSVNPPLLWVESISRTLL